MKRHYRSNYVSKNGFSPATNQFVGRTAYSVAFLLITLVSYKIWGTKMLTELWFYLAQGIAYLFVGFFLRWIGFWVY